MSKHLKAHVYVQHMLFIDEIPLFLYNTQLLIEISKFEIEIARSQHAPGPAWVGQQCLAGL